MGDSNGKKFNQSTLDAFKKVPKGAKIWIEEIKVKMPDGKIQTLPASISLTVT